MVIVNVSELLPLELWKNALLRPKETFAKEKKNTSVVRGVKQIALASLFWSYQVGRILELSFASIFLPLVSSVAYGDTFWISNIVMGVIGFLAVLFVFFAVNVVWWVIAKILGGRGEFSTQYFLAALYAAPITLLVFLATFIPFVGFLFQSAMQFYWLYLSVLMIREAHDLSALKAAIVVLLPVIIVLVLIGAWILFALLSLQGASGLRWHGY